MLTLFDCLIFYLPRKRSLWFPNRSIKLFSMLSNKLNKLQFTFIWNVPCESPVPLYSGLTGILVCHMLSAWVLPSLLSWNSFYLTLIRDLFSGSHVFVFSIFFSRFDKTHISSNNEEAKEQNLIPCKFDDFIQTSLLIHSLAGYRILSRKTFSLGSEDINDFTAF